MHRLLLAAAASAAALIATSPAVAQSVAATAEFSSSSGSTGNPVFVGRPAHGTFHGVRVHRGHGGGRFDDSGFFTSGYNDPGDYDANRSFDPDKWNDWWHDRPERAFPRWMSRNQDCARRWYSGDVLTC
jgi:hypothetical protein